MSINEFTEYLICSWLLFYSNVCNMLICSSFTVYDDCDINECQNGGSCKKLGVSYICECVNGFSGLLCQIGM